MQKEVKKLKKNQQKFVNNNKKVSSFSQKSDAKQSISAETTSKNSYSIQNKNNELQKTSMPKMPTQPHVAQGVNAKPSMKLPNRPPLNRKHQKDDK